MTKAAGLGHVPSASLRSTARSMGPVVRVVARRPGLWLAALGALRRLAAPGWWRQPPYLPFPDRRLWAFRMVTAYGQADAVPRAGDVASYLSWCRWSGRGAIDPLSLLARHSGRVHRIPAEATSHPPPVPGG